MDHFGKHAFEPVWHLPQRLLRSQVAPALWSWLLDASSLTRRLQRCCRHGFRVELLQQGHALPMLSEARALGIKPGRWALVREVRLMCGEQPWVFARTVIPLATLTGAQRRLGHLGNRPLGALLFRDRSMRRGQLEVARIARGQRLFRLATRELNPLPPAIWGRRSSFYLRGKPLLVCEMFLPGVGEDQS